MLTIVNDDLSLTIVNIIVNKKNQIFKSDRVLKKQSYKNGRKSSLKTIVFFPKTKRSFLKTIEKRNKKRSFSKRINNPKVTFLTLLKFLDFSERVN